MKKTRYGRRYHKPKMSYIVIPIILIIALLGTVVYGRYLQNMINDYREVVESTDKYEETTVTNPVVQTDIPKNNETTVVTPEDESIVSSLKNFKGAYINLQNYSTLEDFEEIAKELKNTGFTAVTIDIKHITGKLSYFSNLGQAIQYKANPNMKMLPLSEIVEVFHKNDLFVSGIMNVFKDDTAAVSNQSIAIKHTSGVRWTDGSSRWVSVYSDEGRKYMIDIMNEVNSAGVDELVLYNYHLPYSNPKYPEQISYNDNGISKETIVNQFITEIKNEIPTLSLGLIMSHDILSTGSQATMGINVEQLSQIADFIAADFSISKISSKVKINGSYINSPKNNPSKTITELCHEFAALSEEINFRPILEPIDTEIDISQTDTLIENGYPNWQWLKY